MHTDSPSPIVGRLSSVGGFLARRVGDPAYMVAVVLTGAIQIIIAARSPAIAKDGITFVN